MGNGGAARRALALGIGLFLIAGCGDDAEGDDGAPAYATVEMLRGPWQPTPLLPDPELLATAQAECLWMDVRQPRDAVLVVADARGGGVLQLAFATPNGDGFACLQMPISPTGSVEQGSGSGHGGEGVRLLGAFEILVTGMPTSIGLNGVPLDTTVIGRVGGGIAQVQIHSEGEPPIVATLWDGWFTAWWPGLPRGTAVAFDPGGSAVARIDLVTWFLESD